MIKGSGMFLRAKPRIEFLCQPEDLGIFAEPVPAKTVIPDWFRKLPPVDKNHLTANDNGLTIKRCMPFLDAMSAGWILPIGATIRLQVSDAGQTVNAGWEIDREMVSNHSMHQVTGNPLEPRPPCKIHNYWTVRTPPGWSCLFIPPLNRPNPVIQVVSGIVDTDTYQSLINFPFFAIAPDGTYTLERGSPLVQVIPFRRDTSAIEAVVRAESAEEADKRNYILRNTQAAEGWYRLKARAKR